MTLPEPITTAGVEPGLDAAWKAAQAALPEGWGLVLSCRDGMNDVYAVNPVMSTAWEVAANGSTPTAALLALATRLQENPQ